MMVCFDILLIVFLDIAEKEGLKRKLKNNLSPEAVSLARSWEVGECIATYWRPNFDPLLYPYLPAHITKPKEIKKLFLVPLPESCYLAVRCGLLLSSPRCQVPVLSLKYLQMSFKLSLEALLMVQVPRNAKLVAVPLFELHENAARYGPIISALPHLLSRFKLILVGSSVAIPAAAPSADGMPVDHQETQLNAF
jgi:cleavage and polyadenylation specificity factor subunit 5